MKKYQTDQRKRLLDFFAANPDRQFTIDAFEKLLVEISVSAIYRNINQRVEEGSRKFLYHYIGSDEGNENFHLKCSERGSIFHVQDTASDAPTDMIRESADFNLDMSRTMLFGACKSCKE